jgi:Mg-chelatase subunit ChlD
MTAAAACALLAACSLGGVNDAMAGAPLPPSWQTGQQEPQQGNAPLWGVPDFEAPSATHCRGPARLNEVPGGLAGGQSHREWPMPVAKAAVPDHREREAGESAPAMALSAPRAVAPAPLASPAPAEVQQRVAPNAVVTAGMVDDNADFGEYLAYRSRQRWPTRERDIAERYRVEVRDVDGKPVPDAELALSWPGAREGLLWGRSDAGGLAWLHPRALVEPGVLSGVRDMEVQVRAGGRIVRASLQRGQKQAVQVTLPVRAARPSRVPLDLVFLVDATGSMGDEIAKLKASVRSIASQVAALPSGPDLCLGLVAYRDKGDAFLLRTHDLTDRLGDFQRSLDALQAEGGGDEPEALDEAWHEVVHRISWRGVANGQAASRLVVLISDAPPHLDYGGPYYDQDMAAALAKGIKLHAVGASGLSPTGEAVFRQMAQYTGGRFVFLTYRHAHDPSSGPGSETVHDVSNYSVDTLDKLIVRLVREELQKRG